MSLLRLRITQPLAECCFITAQAGTGLCPKLVWCLHRNWNLGVVLAGELGLEGMVLIASLLSYCLKSAGHLPAGEGDYFVAHFPGEERVRVGPHWRRLL